MAKATKTDGVWNTDINPGEEITFSTAGTYVDGDINVKAAAASDTKVTQTGSTTDADYRLILSKSANGTTETSTTYKSNNFTANPGTGLLYAKYLNVNSNLAGEGKFAESIGGHLRVGETLYARNLGMSIAADFDNVTKTALHGSWVQGGVDGVGTTTSYLKLGQDSGMNGVLGVTNGTGGIGQIISPASNSTYQYRMPSKSGTIALTSDIPTVPPVGDNTLVSGSGAVTGNSSSRSWTPKASYSISATNEKKVYLVIAKASFNGSGGKRGIKIVGSGNEAEVFFTASSSGTIDGQCVGLVSIESTSSTTATSTIQASVCSTVDCTATVYMRVIRLH